MIWIINSSVLCVCVILQTKTNMCTHPAERRGKVFDEDGSEREDVNTNVATVAAAGEKRHIVL